MLDYDRKLKYFSRLLRLKMTDSEKALWSKIRRKQICGLQFYRQKPIGKYIVDFYAPGAKLAVEVDGSQHRQPGQVEQDKLRDEYLADQGLKVLRFNSREVLLELDAVADKIALVVEEKLKD